MNILGPLCFLQYFQRLATRYRDLNQFIIWPPVCTTRFGFKFGHQVAPLTLHYWLRPIERCQFGFQNFTSHFIFIQIFQIYFSTLPLILSASSYIRYTFRRQNEHFAEVTSFWSDWVWVTFDFDISAAEEIHIWLGFGVEHWQLLITCDTTFNISLSELFKMDFHDKINSINSYRMSKLICTGSLYMLCERQRSGDFFFVIESGWGAGYL